MKKIAIIATTDRALDQAIEVQKEFPKSLVITTRDTTNDCVSVVDSLAIYIQRNFAKLDGLCFIGSLGACVRLIATEIKDKTTDPAVICLDDQGIHVQAVLSGHIGGANDFAKKVAQRTGGKAIISTSSDLQDIWALDTLAQEYAWSIESEDTLNSLIAKFVNNTSTAVLLETKDKGTDYLEKTVPDFVDVFYQYEDIDQTKYGLLVTVSPFVRKASIPTLNYRPKVLSIGSGCSKELDDVLFEERLFAELEKRDLSKASIRVLGSIDIKAQQSAYLTFSEKHNIPFVTFSEKQIKGVTIPNPSDKVREKIGVDGVSESTAMLLAENDVLVEKQKIHLDNGHKFTFSVAIDRASIRRANIVIVGAGPGGVDLITLRGKEVLEKADCVLYAGSLVPEQMLTWSKEGAVIANSAMMTLEEQMNMMREHYQKGHLIVRLHSGDQSIYGATQEQMSLFDEEGMNYEIVPGISSFVAAAAILKSEFTIPEVVQTIIITRGEGKTPLPTAERLEDMAKLKATICLFLSAGIAQKVQNQLLTHYAPDTPVAVLYRATWEDEEVFTGQLQDLAAIIKSSKKTRTVLIIVGQAIGARKNRSQLYSPDWKHIFRTNKKFVLQE